MIENLIASSINDMFDFFYTAFQNLNFDIIFWIGIGLMLSFSVIGIVKMSFCYEAKTIRGIKRINRYLLQNPSITEENLVTFHNYIKKMPQRIRDRWQLFVLERDGLPSRYLTTEYCVKRPLVNSVLISVGKQITLSSIVLSLITFILGLGYSLANAAGTVSVSNLIDASIYALATPAIILLIGGIMRMIIQLRISTVSMNLYDVFNVFVRNVNRAVATMPDSIDYEVLFTQREIDDGIPILREYLEKKALEEQQLLEQSKYEAVSHSPYNFKDLGVNGEQLISRAVEESESFLMKKIGLQNEIEELEKKQTQAEDNMDDIEKEANRKLQAIKENLERLDKAIAETTNRVEINYNRRQIKDEIEKRALIEKDLKSLLSKEQVTLNECKAEIQKRKDMIEKDKAQVEVALKSEYDTFAVKVYDTLNDKVSEENVDTVKDYQTQIVELKTKIQSLNRELETKDSAIAEKDLEISNIYNNNEKAVHMLKGKPVEENDNAQQPNNEDNTPQPNLMNSTTNQDLGQCYDENGNLIDYSQYYDENGNLIDYSQYYDENGNLIDYSQYYDENGNYIGPTQEEWKEKEEQQAVQNAQQVATKKAIKKVKQKAVAPKESKVNKTSKSKKQEVATKNEQIVVEPENVAKEQIDTSAPQTQTSLQSAEKVNTPTAVVPTEKTKASKKSKTRKPTKKIASPKKTGKVKQGAKKLEVKTTLKTDKKLANPKTTKKIQPNKVENEKAKKPISKKVEPKKMATKKIGKLKSVEKKSKQGESKVKKLEAKITPKTEKKIVDNKKAKTPVNKIQVKAEDSKLVKPEAKLPEMETKDYDFNEIQKQIDEENAKLQQQQSELKAQIDQALLKIEKSPTSTNKVANTKKIKELIDKLKEQAKRARANGATKEQIRSINTSVAELVDVITKYSSKK